MTQEESEKLRDAFREVPDTWDDLEERIVDDDYDFENRVCISNPLNMNRTWAYRVRRHLDNKKVCIKIQELGRFDTEEVKKYNTGRMNEIRIGAKLNKYNETINFFDVFKDEEYLVIVSELCEFGDLSGWRKQIQKTRQFIPEKDVCKGIAQIFQALLVFHSNGIIHRDIKCQNVFVRQQIPLQLCLGDFGESIDVSQQ